MKGITTIVVATALTMGIVSGSWAASFPKKNPPKNRRAVEEILKAIGGKHYPEHMKLTADVGSIKTDSTWYHVYAAYDRDQQDYRAIFFDNTPKYLGYYEMPYEPSDVGEGTLKVTAEDSSSDGGSGELTITIPDKGPPKAIRFSNGVTANFVPAPAPKEAATTTTTPKEETATLPTGTTTNPEDTTAKSAQPKPAAPEKMKPQYREWTVAMNGQKITFSAVYVKYDRFKKTVTLKSAKTGTTADIDINQFSLADKKYLAELLKD